MDGTVATTCVLVQLTTEAYVLPSHTDPVPCAAPNAPPEMVTCAPAEPEVGDTLVIAGEVTAKLTPLLAAPPNVTTTCP